MGENVDRQQQRFPDFIVLGAQKAGSQAIHVALMQTPGVYVAKSEVSFFNIDYNYSLGMPYYATFFKAAKDGDVMGEVTPGYLYSQDAPKRIAECLPSVKLIACLRNPVERAFSSYYMQVLKGAEVKPFFDAIQSNPTYIGYGRYYQQISLYLSFFPEQQIKIFLHDDLKQNPGEFYKSMMQFLGVEFFMPDNRKVNERRMPKHAVVSGTLNLAYRFRNTLRSSSLGWLVTNKVVDSYSRALRNKIANWNSEKVSGVTDGIDIESRRYIVRYLRDDILELSKMLGRDLSHWLAD